MKNCRLLILMAGSVFCAQFLYGAALQSIPEAPVVPGVAVQAQPVSIESLDRHFGPVYDLLNKVKKGIFELVQAELSKISQDAAGKSAEAEKYRVELEAAKKRNLDLEYQMKNFADCPSELKKSQESLAQCQADLASFKA